MKYFYASEKPTKPESLKEYIYSKKYFNKLKKMLYVYKPHIIHLHNYYHLLSPSILDCIKKYKKNNITKVLMTAHDFHIVAPNSGLTYFGWFDNQLCKLKNNPARLDIFTKKWDHRGLYYSIEKQLQWFYAYKIKKQYEAIDIFISPSHFLANFIKKEYPKKEMEVTAA